ncbi:hypothetical protein SAMN02799624_01114 [Paenibacillus sp. UNC496MF]|uniref:hypothetical protein n=1 Tax=Paenibacillus sp. UNC496MF TaxID=1502753 RepID=UPI0008E12463|nr:hypothetical protein [Paenibacillus sp. UNC496MF]SFI50872.1 hypothetical protein SAMN02799624_01114 [Paenibacillus sp. UNC496MF]
MEAKPASLPGTDLPAGLSKPARRALANAGLTGLAQVARLSAGEFLALHGIGPKAVDLIREAMAVKGLGFKGDS